MRGLLAAIPAFRDCVGVVVVADSGTSGLGRTRPPRRRIDGHPALERHLMEVNRLRAEAVWRLATRDVFCPCAFSIRHPTTSTRCRSRTGGIASKPAGHCAEPCPPAPRAVTTAWRLLHSERAAPAAVGLAAEATRLSPPVGEVRPRACASPLRSAAPSRLGLPPSQLPPVVDGLESQPQRRTPQPDSRALDRDRSRPRS